MNEGDSVMIARACKIGELLLVGMIGGVFGSRVLIPTKIDKHFIWLSKVSPEYLSGLRDWNI